MPTDHAIARLAGLTTALIPEGPENDQTSRRLLQDLRDIASNTLHVHELHIHSQIGADEFLRIADDWLEKRKEGLPFGVAAGRLRPARLGLGG